MSTSVFDKSLPLAIGSDHAGFEYKELVKKHLEMEGWTISDKGTFSTASVDYPDFAHPVATMVESGAASVGILLCGSGNGVCITANKHQGIRAALCFNEELASLARQHNNANILCIPARFISTETALGMVDVFLETAFEGGRHAARIAKI